MTSGRQWQPFLIAWALFAIVAALTTAVNAMSVIADRAALGRPVPAWEPWAWELTSLAGWLLAAPLALAGIARLAPLRLGWPAVVAGHVLLSIAVSVVHVGAMTLLRWGVYAAMGERWKRAGALGDVLLYEYRKDAVAYVMLALLYAGARHVLAAKVRPTSAAPGAAEARIEVKDGPRTLWLAPADIQWAQAAGNYVELHGTFGTLLDRRTLAALEAELGPFGFVRIHRSRIVRADAVRAIEARSSGDFEVMLTGDRRIGGSRRYRGRLGGSLGAGFVGRG